jgi:hypothetical protein
MKSTLIVLLIALSISNNLYALDSFQLKFGIGTDACHPNIDGLKQCESYSPNTEEINIPLNLEPENTAAYGQYVKTGHFEKIGYEVSVKVTHFPYLKIDDMLTLKVETWPLQNPADKREILVESFTRGPENLSRLNIPGQIIGTEEDYSNIILSVRKSEKLNKKIK